MEPPSGLVVGSGGFLFCGVDHRVAEGLCVDDAFGWVPFELRHGLEMPHQRLVEVGFFLVAAHPVHKSCFGCVHDPMCGLVCAGEVSALRRRQRSLHRFGADGWEGDRQPRVCVEPVSPL